MGVPKINTPINTLQAPSNSLQPCMKEALFLNPLLKTWAALDFKNLKSYAQHQAITGNEIFKSKLGY